MPPLDDTGAPPFDPDRPFTTTSAPAAVPPPFDPGKPFTAAPQAGGAPPPFDPSKPFSPAPEVPLFTREKPFEAKPAKTAEEYGAQFTGLVPGTFVNTPTGELMRTPQPKPEEAPIDATTGEKIDYQAGLEPAVRDTGILGAVPAGLVGA